MRFKPKIIITDDPVGLAKSAAARFTVAAKTSVARHGIFVAALSGGSTPRAMHRMLAEEPYCSDVPWKKTHIFWVDERCVPWNDPASNYGLAKKDFLDRVPIAAENIHPMDGEAPREDGARRYERELEAFFQLKKGEVPVFDLIFLGVGKDGHTASLFPGKDPAEASERWVAAVKGGIPDIYRLTLTYEVLNQAREVYLLVSGKEKAPIVKTAIENKEAALPAQRIQPINGKLAWLLDMEAASLLSGEISRGAK